jgi:hypothetical protein
VRSGGNAAGGALPRIAGDDVTARRGRGGTGHAHSGRPQENKASEGEEQSGGGGQLSVSASALSIFESKVEERGGQCWQENNVTGTFYGDHSRSKNIYSVKYRMQIQKWT